MIIPDPADLLRDLVRVNTANPPGHESEASALLRPLLTEAGAEVSEIAAEPGRGNLIATLPAASDVDTSKAPLVLISHLDVVPASSNDWSQPPFAANTVDGIIYGRGTLDTKQLTVMETVAVLRAAQRSHRQRPIVLIASADEECGSRKGMAHLAEQKPELFEREGTVVISEGGGFPIAAGDHTIYPITSGEKGAAVVGVRVEGKGGHASNPSTDPALSRIAGLVERLAELRFDPVESEIVTGMRAAFGFKDAGVVPDTLAGTLVRYASDTSITVNKIEAGTRVNVVPAQASLEIEVRFPPGESKECILQILAPALNCPGLEWELLRYDKGFVSDIDSPFITLARKKLTDACPEAELLPVLALGRTDGRFFHPHACNVYGFSPLLSDAAFESVLKWVHGVDERISEESIRWGTNLMTDLVQEYVEN